MTQITRMWALSIFPDCQFSYYQYIRSPNISYTLSHVAMENMVFSILLGTKKLNATVLSHFTQGHVFHATYSKQYRHRYQLLRISQLHIKQGLRRFCSYPPFLPKNEATTDFNPETIYHMIKNNDIFHSKNVIVILIYGQNLDNFAFHF